MYRKDHRSFNWYRFEKQNLVKHKEFDEISHIVSDYLLTIRFCSKNCHKILQIKDNCSQRIKYNINLPDIKKIYNFYPKLSEDQSLILLMITRKKVHEIGREARF